MSVETKFSEDGERVEFVITGDIHIDDVVNAVRELNSHPDFMKVKYQLVDYTGLGVYETSRAGSNEMVSLDKQAAEKNPNMRVAIIAPPTSPSAPPATGN